MSQFLGKVKPVAVSYILPFLRSVLRRDWRAAIDDDFDSMAIIMTLRESGGDDKITISFPHEFIEGLRPSDLGVGLVGETAIQLARQGRLRVD